MKSLEYQERQHLLKQMKTNLKKFFRSFGYAFNGISHAVMTQRNLRFHIVTMVFVLILSSFYELSNMQYALLFLTFSSVIVCELINTAIEAVVDLCSPEYQKLAKTAKDTAAGAVLVSAVFSVVIAVYYFWNMEVFSRIGMFFCGNIPALIGIIVLALISFVFIFIK